MQEVTETGTMTRRGRLEEGDEVESKPLVKSPALVALITKEFKAIERIEEDIAERRDDIKYAVKRLVGKGLSRKGVKAALARRKLVVKGGLADARESPWRSPRLPLLPNRTHKTYNHDHAVTY